MFGEIDSLKEIFINFNSFIGRQYHFDMRYNQFSIEDREVMTL